jgi:hypothetical protein
MKSKIYQMTYSEDDDYASFGVAYSMDSEFFQMPYSGTKVESWTTKDLHLRNGGFADYLANDLGVRLCSQKLRKIIDEINTAQDFIQWLPVNVLNEGGAKQYSILHFPVNVPVVNREKSLIVGDMLVKAVLNKDVAEKLTIFTLPNEPGRTIYVSSSLKKLIEDSKCTGISFHATKCD